MTSFLLNSLKENLNIEPKVKRINTSNESVFTHANLSKSKRILGYNPKTPIEIGVKEFVQWYRNYYGSNQHDVTGPGYLAKFKHLFGDDCLQMRLSKDMLIYYYRDVYIKYMKNDLQLTHNLYRDLWEKRNFPFE